MRVKKVVSVDDLGIQNHMRSYKCNLENDGSPDSKKFFMFRFFDDELSFDTEELVGKTEEECHNLFLERDKAYLQS